MTTRSEFIRLALAALASPSAAPTVPATDAAAEAIFKHAKDVWRGRTDLPFLAYSMRERYRWRERSHETWWHAWYRLSDRTVALQRIVIEEDERQRLKGSPISIHMRFHQKNAPASFNLDTNPNADAFPVLDPLIEPIGSFGMLRPLNARLVEGDAASAAPALATPSPAPAPSALPTSGAGIAAPEAPLLELARVEAVSRDYRIANLGVERLRDGDAYHLTLEPLRAPYRYRLRDLWIATADYRTLQLATQGLFVGPPYDTARWVVAYTQIGGRSYVQEISSPETLRFGPQHGVTEFAFDFVDYSFPATVPQSVFTKLL